MLRRLATLLLLAPALGCIQLDAELPEVCVTQSVTFTAPTNSLVAAVGEQVVDFLPQEVHQLSALALTSGSLAVSPAGAVGELKIVLHPPDGSTDFDLELLHLRPVGEGAAFPDTQADLLPYAGGKIGFKSTDVPPDGTTFFVTICGRAQLSKTLRLAR